MRALLLLAVAACGDPVNHGLDAAVGHPDAAPDAREIDAPAALPRQGLITFSESSFNNMAGSSLQASFTDGSPMGAAIATDGPCTTYPLNMHGQRSAGTIAVTGTTTAITLTPNGTAPNVSYTDTPAAPTDLYTPHTTLHVVGAGGPDFAAFTGDVATPTTLVFTPPTTISRAGKTLTWTADTATAALIAMFATNGSGIPALMFCRVPDTGSYAVTATQLALAFPSDATTAVVAIGRAQETVVTNASGTVTLQVISAVGSQSVTITP